MRGVSSCPDGKSAPPKSDTCAAGHAPPAAQVSLLGEQTYHQGMKTRLAWRAAPSLLACLSLLSAQPLRADQVPVRHTEGRLDGFLVLRDLEDNIIRFRWDHPVGQWNPGYDRTQLPFQGRPHRQRVDRLFAAKGLQLLSYRLVQKGKSFKRPTDMSLNASTGQVTVRYTDEDGQEKTITDRPKLPADLANGMVSTPLRDLRSQNAEDDSIHVGGDTQAETRKLDISPVGEDSFTVGGSGAKAMKYVVKVDIGGISGEIAP